MNAKDLVTLVNENDQVLGSMDKIEAHRGEGTLHRASSVFLFRENPKTNEQELLIQKRSQKKIVGANQWANTVCGNVWPEESYEECARRRLAFELGIDEANLVLSDVTTFRYQAVCNDEFSENEIVHIFKGYFNGEVKPNGDEVAETQWIDWNDAQKLQLDANNNFTPWFKLFMKEKKVIESLEQ